MNKQKTEHFLPKSESLAEIKVEQVYEQKVSQQALSEGQAYHLPKEINGPKGLEPTRYGDWEAKGRCYDF